MHLGTERNFDLSFIVLALSCLNFDVALRTIRLTNLVVEFPSPFSPKHNPSPKTQTTDQNCVDPRSTPCVTLGLRAEESRTVLSQLHNNFQSSEVRHFRQPASFLGNCRASLLQTSTSPHQIATGSIIVLMIDTFADVVQSDR